MTKGHMTYLGGGEQQHQPSGARKYTGAVAKGYDAKREDSPKWKAEQEMLEAIIKDLPPGTKVLDIPTGTGRLIPALCAKKLPFVAADVSQDMLIEALKKVPADYAAGEYSLVSANVIDMPFGNEQFDISFMIRLTRWLDPKQRRDALDELCRVTSDRVYFTARVGDSEHQYTFAQIEADTPEGWEYVPDQIGDDPYYMLIELERI